MIWVCWGSTADSHVVCDLIAGIGAINGFALFYDSGSVEALCIEVINRLCLQCGVIFYLITGSSPTPPAHFLHCSIIHCRPSWRRKTLGVCHKSIWLLCSLTVETGQDLLGLICYMLIAVYGHFCAGEAAPLFIIYTDLLQCGAMMLSAESFSQQTNKYSLLAVSVHPRK